MPGIKGNRRTLYTKKIIKESLIELLQTNDIHQITVTNICNKADINRGTFYSYYKDAFDLLQSIEEESLIELLQTNDIHQITVTNICNKADINRGTFYSYYKDAFDLLQSIEDELFDQILRYLNETPAEDYTDSLLIKVLELIAENKDLCKILLCKQRDGRIIDRILYIASKANLKIILIHYLLKFLN